MKGLLLFLSLLFVFGCSTLPKRDVMEKEVANWQLPHQPKKGEGVVYVVRPSSLGGLIRFNVFLDEHADHAEMGWNRGSQYIYFFTKPGVHKIWSVAENTKEMEFQVEANKSTIIKQNTSMGIIMARNELELVLDEVVGKYMVKKANLGTVKQIRLPRRVGYAK